MYLGQQNMNLHILLQAGISNCVKCIGNNTCVRINEGINQHHIAEIIN